MRYQRARDRLARTISQSSASPGLRLKYHKSIGRIRERGEPVASWSWVVLGSANLPSHVSSELVQYFQDNVTKEDVHEALPVSQQTLGTLLSGGPNQVSVTSPEATIYLTLSPCQELL